METVNQRIPSPLEFSSKDILVIILMETSGHSLILELGLCCMRNLFCVIILKQQNRHS